MKLQPRAIESFLRKPDPRVRAILVFGGDVGLVRERAERLGRGVCQDLADPFRVAELTPENLSADPARLYDEAAALALTGGRRLIRVRDGGDGMAGVFERFCREPPPGDALVVVEGGDLPSRSRLRLVFEAAECAAALPCYTEGEDGLGPIVVGLAEAQGLNLDVDAQAYLAANLVGDRQVAHREIEKLALYMGSTRRVTLEDVEACIGDSSALATDDPVWAAASGDPAALDRALGRLFGEGVAAVAILRAAQRHFQRLHLAAAAVAGGASPESAVAALKPPIFYKRRGDFAAQLRLWTAAELDPALERLTQAEADCKRTGMPDQTVCGRVLIQLAAFAAGRRRRRS
ncbi:MAG: DNA polymerase III subunit delta [Azospirillum sp.]|nr:DNA polymerase III subunit delta [Azospirillum sp.]